MTKVFRIFYKATNILLVRKLLIFSYIVTLKMISRSIMGLQPLLHASRIAIVLYSPQLNLLTLSS
jgi:hypothetical protein